jgi:hypothetical protein
MCEARKRVRFAAKVTQAQLMVSEWVPDFAFHPVGFDRNGHGARLSGASSTSQLPFSPSPQRNLKLASSVGLFRLFPALSRG